MGQSMSRVPLHELERAQKTRKVTGKILKGVKWALIGLVVASVLVLVVGVIAKAFVVSFWLGLGLSIFATATTIVGAALYLDEEARIKINNAERYGVSDE